jgi:hypothetical protein
MTTTRIEPTPAAVRTGTPPRSRLLLSAAAVASAGRAALASVWLARPEWGGYTEPTSALLRAWLGADQVTLVHLVVSVAGLLVAVAGLVATTGNRPWPRWLLPAGLVLGGVAGIGLLGITVIMGAGYAMAVLVPLGAVLVTVQLVRRGGAGRWLALAAAALVALVVTLVAQQPGVDRLLEMLSRLLVEWPRTMAAPFWMLGTAVVWLGVAGHAARQTGEAGRTARWVLRHRPAITVVAALGPLPYALVRLTWFTPWPLLSPGDAMTADMRVWGIMLSLGAWAGFVMTLGLIRRWGEVFPRWMPLAAGRPVPVWFAAVPGGLVAATLCASAAPMLLTFGQRSLAEGLVSAVIFPMWLWGPALALAVWGYVLHRRAGSRPEEAGYGVAGEVRGS